MDKFNWLYFYIKNFMFIYIFLFLNLNIFNFVVLIKKKPENPASFNFEKLQILKFN